MRRPKPTLTLKANFKCLGKRNLVHYDRCRSAHHLGVIHTRIDPDDLTNAGYDYRQGVAHDHTKLSAPATTELRTSGLVQLYNEPQASPWGLLTYKRRLSL